MTRMLVTAVVVAGALALGACGGDDTRDDPPAEVPGSVRDQDRDDMPDSDQDRDRVHQAIADALGAYEDQDRDRLAVAVGDPWRAEADDAAFLYPAGTTFALLDQAVTVSGDTARAHVRLRAHTPDGVTEELDQEWTLHRDGGGWLLDGLPLCRDAAAEAPDHDQERDRTRDPASHDGEDADG